MSRYFFSCDGAQSFVDQVGTELADLDAARLQAVQNAAEIMRDDPTSFAQCGEWRMTVSEGAVPRIRLSVHIENLEPGRKA